jgi:branched-chain amino acid transport system substrate-binding protein
VVPQSGPYKPIGEHARQAIVLAVEDANTEGRRILNRKVAVLHPAIADSAPKLQPLAVRLITVEKVAALFGGVDTDQVKTLGRAAQPYDLPLVTTAELPPELLGGNIFSVNAGLHYQGLVLAQFAAKELKLAGGLIAVTDSRRSASEAVTDAFVREFTKHGGTRFQERRYKSAAELTEIVDVIKRAQPQALWYAGAVVDLERLRGKLHEAGLKLPILVGTDKEAWSELLTNHDAGNGVYVATPFVAGEGPAATLEFVKKYQGRFHELPDVHAALAYDGVRVLFETMRRAESTASAKLLEKLAEASGPAFDALCGPLTFSKNHVARRPLYVVQLEDGQLTKPKLYPAEEP